MRTTSLTFFLKGGPDISIYINFSFGCPPSPPIFFTIRSFKSAFHLPPPLFFLSPENIWLSCTVCEMWSMEAKHLWRPTACKQGQKSEQKSEQRKLCPWWHDGGFFPLTFSVVFFHIVICLWLGKTMANHLPGISNDPHCPIALWVGDKELKKSVWHTSWRHYRSMARWMGWVETPEWRRLFTIFTAGRSISGGSGFWLRHDVTNTRQKKNWVGVNTHWSNKKKKSICCL